MDNQNIHPEGEVGAPSAGASGDSLRSSEYPIRARVKPEGSQYYWPSMRAMVGGIHDFMRHESGSYYCRNGWAWAPANLEIISDAAGLPKPSPAEGPSQVTPTKAPVVDLEWAETWFTEMHSVTRAKTKEIGLSLIAEVRSLRSQRDDLVNAIRAMRPQEAA